MAYIPDAAIEQMRRSHMLGIFMYVGTDPALHIWFGDEDKTANFDSVDEDGTVYLGGGRLIGLPSLEVLINGAADRVEFTLSGIDPDMNSMLINTIPPVRGAVVKIGITPLDQYYQPVTSIIPIWEGVASHLGESSPTVQPDKTASVTLALAVVSGEQTRSRASRAIWSGAHQKAVSPTDKFCDEVSRLARGVQPAWPVYS